MNKITEHQSEEKFLTYLRAQMVAYDLSKTSYMIDIFCVVIAIGLPSLCVFSIIPFNIFGMTSGFWLFFYLITERIRKFKTVQRARILEQFDTELYEIPWNDTLCKTKVKPKVLKKLADKNSRKNLDGCYSTAIRTDLPQEIAILLCQRTNFSKRRLNTHKLFMRILFCCLVAYYGFLMVIFNIMGIEGTRLAILLIPSFPILLYAIANGLSYISISKLRKKALRAIDKKLQRYNNAKHVPNTDELRAIQDLIYCIRIIPNRIPGWFNRYNDERASIQELIISRNLPQ